MPKKRKPAQTSASEPITSAATLPLWKPEGAGSSDIEDQLVRPGLAQRPVGAVRLAEQVLRRAHPLVGEDRAADADFDLDHPVAPLGLEVVDDAAQPLRGHVRALEVGLGEQ